jgi:NADH-quinone oxidoreductase subunit L
MGAYAAGMFHLLTHGLFKALLFLAAGAIIHGAHDIQDMRRMGGLRAKFPTTFRLYVVGALALAGIFPLAGFWSKDEIIGYAWFTARNPCAALTLIVASLFTAYYMGRQVALIFFGKQRDTSYTAHEAQGPMLWPMVVLGFGAIIGGIMNLPGVHWLSDYLQPTLNEPPAEFTLGHGILATVTVLASAGMGYLGWWLYARRWEGRVKPGKEDPMERFLGDIWRGSGMGWGLDWLYDRAVVRPYRWLGALLTQVFDREGIDGILVEGPAKVFGQLSRGFSTAQNGYIRSYTLLFLVGVLLLLGYMVLVSGQ